MSYILEALKKSQQERELGKVPTLTTASPGNAGRVAVANRLLPLALLLALLSLLIALYAVLGGRFTAQEVADQPTRMSAPLITPARPTATPDGSMGSGSMGSESNRPKSVSNSNRRVGGLTPTPGPNSNRRVGGLTPTPGPTSATITVPPAPPLREAPKPPAATEPVAQVTETGRPTADELRQELLEVRRMLEQKEVPSHSLERPSPATEPAPLPMERASGTGNRNPVPGDATGTEGHPDLARTLPDAIRQHLPNRRLSVLSYAKEPEMRFVILNSEKINEGETSKDGLTVVTIRPEGAILSFEGHRFFQPL